MSDELQNRMIDFLQSIIHGPIGNVDWKKYQHYLETQAREMLNEIENESGQEKQ